MLLGSPPDMVRNASPYRAYLRMPGNTTTKPLSALPRYYNRFKQKIQESFLRSAGETPRNGTAVLPKTVSEPISTITNKHRPLHLLPAARKPQHSLPQRILQRLRGIFLFL